jgi:hypothetical protein
MTSRLLIWSGTIVAAMLLGAAMVLIWAPWHTPAPPLSLATALPKDCPALLGMPGPASMGGGTGPENEPQINCDWGPPESTGPSPVNSTTTLYPSVAAAQRASVAEVTIYQGPKQGFSLGADTPVVGIGDEARITDHDGYLVLVARKANVVLSIQYIAPDNTDPVGNESVLETAARTIINEVVVGP